jgi:methylglutamate dehydrogenase subunit D
MILFATATSRLKSVIQFSSIRSEYASMADSGRPICTPMQRLARPGRFGAATPSPGLLIEERTDLTLATVIARYRKHEDLKRVVARAYALSLPEGPRLVANDGVSFAGTGVYQWLASAESLARPDFVCRLRERLAGLASICDQSDGRAVLRLRGHCVRDVLAKGVAIDLHPRSMRTGDVASTLVAHMGVQIALLDDEPTFQLMVFRSFAESLWSWLIRSAAEFGYEVVRQPSPPTQTIMGGNQSRAPHNLDERDANTALNGTAPSGAVGEERPAPARSTRGGDGHPARKAPLGDG